MTENGQAFGGLAAVVTGGGSGIGLAVAQLLASQGARVAVLDLNPGDEFIGLKADVTDDASVRAAVDTAAERLGGIDVLVNNAGWSRPGFFAEQTDRGLWQHTIEVNLYSAFACTQAVLAPMREAGRGAVVFISSDSAFGAIRQGIYGATKAGLIALARTIAREHGRQGIRSNVIAPGLVLPDEDAQVGPHSVWAAGTDAVFTPEQADYVLRQQPLRRPTTAADIANAVLWISSDSAARQVTGQVVAVGGGSAMP